ASRVDRGFTRRCRRVDRRAVPGERAVRHRGPRRPVTGRRHGVGEGSACSWLFPACLSTFHWAQPGCFGPTTFQPPAHGGRPAGRTCLPSIVSTSTSLEPSACSPSIVTTLPLAAASGDASAHHPGGPTDNL